MTDSCPHWPAYAASVPPRLPSLSVEGAAAAKGANELESYPASNLAQLQQARRDVWTRWPEQHLRRGHAALARYTRWRRTHALPATPLDAAQ